MDPRQNTFTASGGSMSRKREGTFMITDANQAAATGDVSVLENLTLPQLMAVKDRRGWR
jgi:hypothetical protein